MGATNTTPLETSIITKTCPECSTRVEHTRGTPGETTCPDCGLVLAEYSIDHGPDWRNYQDNTRDPRHTQTTDPNRMDEGLGTNIGNAYERNRETQRKHKLNNWTPRGDRRRDYTTQEINRIGTSLGLTNPTIEHAQHLFRRIHSDTDLVKGWDLDAAAASCLYASARIDGSGRTPHDISVVARCEKKPIPRGMWRIAQELSLEIPPPDVEARVRVVGGELGISRSRIRDALSDLPEDTSGVKPSGVVAGVLYENSNLTQERVCGVAGCRPVTLRKARDRVYSD